jgi:glycosyltransferase involved in cell wall biosynthesis
MNILVLEPFMGGYHKVFLKGLEKNSRHSIYSVTMSERYWKWRMHGGSITLAREAEELKVQVDLILASSMTDLSAFMALTNPRFAHTPVAMYMHENQLTQPLPEGESRDMTYCYINYLSALIADKLIFSSKFHFDSFISALPDFLKRFPHNHQHLDTIDLIRNKSTILHPAINLKSFDNQKDTRANNDNPVIVWNQRWSFDKDPGLFFRVMNRLDDAGFQFDLILAGDNRHDKPVEFEKAWNRYGHRIIHYGYVEDFEIYSKLLHQADIVVSTATYEFFCAAIMEAVYCGCHPVLPDGLTYTELIPEHLRHPLLHAPVFYKNEDELFDNLKRMLKGDTKPLPIASLQSINKHLDWSVMIQQYDELFEVIAETKKEISPLSGLQ